MVKAGDRVEISYRTQAIVPRFGVVQEVWWMSGGAQRRALVKVEGGGVELMFLSKLLPYDWREKAGR